MAPSILPPTQILDDVKYTNRSSQKVNLKNVELLPSDLAPAELQVIDLELLRRGDRGQAKALYQACENFGFFYLDLRSMEGGSFLDVIDEMYELDRDLYDLPDDEKMRYDVDKIGKQKLNGYKPVGRNYGGINGKRDGFETYAMPKDGIMGIGGAENFIRPTVIDDYMTTLRRFCNGMGVITNSILTSLSTTLSLPGDENFATCHRFNVPNSDIVRLLKYHAQPVEERGASHTPHTDLGSLTILFTRQCGLQVLAPGADEWKYVAPRDGFAIVNLGDGMSRLSNGLLHSCLHRVCPLPGRPMPTRYSFAYLQRAEDDTPMVGLKSDLIPPADPEVPVYTSAQWLQQKFRNLRLESRVPKESGWVLTGQKKELPQ